VTVYSASHCVVKFLARETVEGRSEDGMKGFVILDRTNLTVKFVGSKDCIYIYIETSPYSSVTVRTYIYIYIYIHKTVDMY
jgi:hypothetical protein